MNAGSASNGLSGYEGDGLANAVELPVEFESQVPRIRRMGGIPVVQRVIVLEREPTLLDMIPKMVLLGIYALVIQTFFSMWKRIHNRSYNICVFLILLLFPPLFFAHVHLYVLPVCWLAFCAFMLLNAVKVMGMRRNKDAMREVYAVFKVLFIVSNAGIFLGQAATVLLFYLAAGYLKYSIPFLLFFLYFGLLSREIIFFLSEMMAASTGFYSKEGVPGKGNNNTLCMICTKTFDGAEEIHTLQCNHSFHEECIKGWCLLGKKSFCPYCKKKVESASLPVELWHKTEVWFFPLINTLRSFIVFTLAMSVVIVYKINYQ